jgi:hypothetical protein
MNDGEVAAGVDAKYKAVTAVRCSVEVAASGGNEAAIGVQAVTSGELVQYFKFALRCDEEDRAAAVGTATRGSPDHGAIVKDLNRSSQPRSLDAVWRVAENVKQFELERVGTNGRRRHQACKSSTEPPQPI